MPDETTFIGFSGAGARFHGFKLVTSKEGSGSVA
jgi:hypothetical protein